MFQRLLQSFEMRKNYVKSFYCDIYCLESLFNCIKPFSYKNNSICDRLTDKKRIILRLNSA